SFQESRRHRLSAGALRLAGDCRVARARRGGGIATCPKVVVPAFDLTRGEHARYRGSVQEANPPGGRSTAAGARASGRENLPLPALRRPSPAGLRGRARNQEDGIEMGSARTDRRRHGLAFACVALIIALGAVVAPMVSSRPAWAVAELFVPNASNNSVTVYRRDASGNVLIPPNRTIVGESTKLNFPVGVAVDPVMNE